MQKVRVPISSFQFGEVSDSLRMRTDSPVYAQSAKSLENMITLLKSRLNDLKQVKDIIQESGDASLSPGTITKAMRICNEGLRSDKGYLTSAKLVTSTMLEMCETWDEI